MGTPVGERPEVLWDRGGPGGHVHGRARACARAPAPGRSSVPARRPVRRRMIRLFMLSALDQFPATTDIIVLTSLDGRAEFEAFVSTLHTSAATAQVPIAGAAPSRAHVP